RPGATEAGGPTGTDPVAAVRRARPCPPSPSLRGPTARPRTARQTGADLAHREHGDLCRGVACGVVDPVLRMSPLGQQEVMPWFCNATNGRYWVGCWSC